MAAVIFDNPRKRIIDRALDDDFISPVAECFDYIIESRDDSGRK